MVSFFRCRPFAFSLTRYPGAVKIFWFPRFVIPPIFANIVILKDGRKLSIARPHGLIFRRRGCCDLRLWHKPAELAHSFLFCSFVCFGLYGPFNCIPFHAFSQELTAFSLCSSDLCFFVFCFFALLVLSTIYLCMKVSLSSYINPFVVEWA